MSTVTEERVVGLERASSPDVKRVKLVSLACVLALFGFSAAAVAVHVLGVFESDAALTWPLVGTLAFGAVSAFVSMKIVRKRFFERARASLDVHVDDNIGACRVSETLCAWTIQRVAVTEGVGAFAAMAFVVSGSWAFLVGSAVAALILIATHPNQARFDGLAKELVGESQGS